MDYSFTGVVYVFLTLGLAIISYRFFLYWKKAQDRISLFFFLGVALLAVVCGFGILAGITWLDYPPKMSEAVIISGFFAVLANAFFGYITFHIKFPRISPWLGFFGILIFGAIIGALSIIYPPQTHLESTGGVNWGIPLPIGILRAILYFLGCFPLFLITINEWHKAKDVRLRVKPFLIGALMLMAVIVPIEDFILEPVFELKALLSEVLILVFAFITLLIYFVSLTVKPPKYVKKVA